MDASYSRTHRYRRTNIKNRRLLSRPLDDRGKFKALKTGCSFEKRQLESLATLLNALAIFVPVAWRLLLLRGMARSHPTAPATIVLTEPQIAVLHAVTKRPLPRNLNVEQALLAIAAPGGHIKNNGQPGWQVLGRGLRKLLNLEEGWTAALRAAR